MNHRVVRSLFFHLIYIKDMKELDAQIDFDVPEYPSTVARMSFAIS